MREEVFAICLTTLLATDPALGLVAIGGTGLHIELSQGLGFTTPSASLLVRADAGLYPNASSAPARLPSCSGAWVVARCGD